MLYIWDIRELIVQLRRGWYEKIVRKRRIIFFSYGALFLRKWKQNLALIGILVDSIKKVQIKYL